jgi:hypothetical protein
MTYHETTTVDVSVSMGNQFNKALPVIWTVSVDGKPEPHTGHQTHSRETTTPLDLANVEEIPDGLEFTHGFIVDCTCGREYIAQVATGEESEFDALRRAEATHVNKFGGWAHVFIGSHQPHLATYADYVLGNDMLADARGPRYYLTPANLDDASNMIEYVGGPGLLIVHTLGDRNPFIPEVVMRELETYSRISESRGPLHLIRRGNEYRERTNKTDAGYIDFLRNDKGHSK